MEAEKFRNLGDDELHLEARKTSEALFRLRFQMKLGQTEGVKKLREMRRDIARIKTIERERELGLHLTPVSKTAAAGSEEAAPRKHAASAKPAKKKTAKPARRKAAKKSASGRKSGGRSATKRAAKPSASRKKAARSSSVKKG